MSIFLGYLNQGIAIATAVAILFCFVSIIIRAFKLKKETKKYGFDQISAVSLLFSMIFFIAFFAMVYSIKEQTNLWYNIFNAVSFIAMATLIIFMLRTIYLALKKSPHVDAKIGILTFWLVAIFAIYTVASPFVAQFAAPPLPPSPELQTPPVPTDVPNATVQ